MMARRLVWISDQNLQGWGCARCAWNFPIPTLLTDEAKDSYDRLASAKFQEHDCAAHPARLTMPSGESFAERARKLVVRGFKPKDAVDVTLQEVLLEHRNDPAIAEQARAEAEQFLRRVREGLI
jgi:hypothetical protein